MSADSTETVEIAAENDPQHATSRVAGLLTVETTVSALSAAQASVRAVLDNDVAPLTALALPAADRAVAGQLKASFDESGKDLDASAQHVASGDLAGASSLYSDAIDHLSQMSSILRRLGASCNGKPQPTHNGSVEPDVTIDVGSYPAQIAATGDDVWVSLQDAGTIVRLDARSNQVSASVPVDDEDLRTIQVTSDGVWVRGATEMHRIDPATNQVTLSIPKSAIGDDVTRAFVDADAIWACDGPAVVRASKEDGHPLATIPLPYRCGTISSGNGQVWVASDVGQPGQLTHIDPATSAIVATIPTSTDDATFPAIGPHAVWTHGQADATNPEAVGVDPATSVVTQTATLPSGSGPGALTATDYYAAATEQGTIKAINVSTGEIDRSYDGGAEPNALAISGTTMWVADEASGQILRFGLT